MKKLLLSMACVLGLGAIAHATDYTIATVGTSDWTLDATAKTLTGVLEATDGTKFNVVIGQNTSKTAIADSKSNDMIKWYKSYTLSITAPAGVTMKTITMTTSGGNYCVAYTPSTETAGTVSTSTPDVVWVNAAGVNSFAATATDGQIRIKSMVISTEAGELPVIETTMVEKTTSISDGKYAFYFAEGGYAQIIAGTGAYGYPYLKEATLNGDSFEIETANLFTFTSTANGYTIQDSKDRFMGMDATHFGSFNLYTSADAEGSNCYWSVEFENGLAKISNVGRAGAYIASKLYNTTWEMVTTDNADQTLPALFKVKADGIADVNVDENAPVEYFNLQGVRVANPENGIFIRRQGTKTSKVYVK